jgi:lipopolysaccharide transport system ATP-binding protein
MQPAIAVENLSKAYRLGASQVYGYRTLRESLANAGSAAWRRLRRNKGRNSAARPEEAGCKPVPQQGETLWALKDVSFDIPAGDVVGIVGRNGAGKSTLLKILSRVTEPTSGRARLRGRVGSLLEVGTGFHTELTGRENIYLNGAICGMSRREIARKFDDIVAFAEVEQFLDTPVKRYSSGMFVRLAFAVASHVDPDILLVDEVLAVGDAAFQRKCLGKMGEVSRSGRTVLFVSHNMATILNLCPRVILIQKGQLAYAGPAEAGIRLYLSDFLRSEGAAVDLAAHPNRRPGCQAVLGRIRLLNEAGAETTSFTSGGPVIVELRARPGCPVSEPHFAIGFEDSLGVRLFTVATYLTDSAPAASRRTGHLLCHIDQLPLVPGRYTLTLNAGPQHAVWTDVIDQAVSFDVLPSDFYGNGRLPNPDWGRFLVRSRWQPAGAAPDCNGTTVSM